MPKRILLRARKGPFEVASAETTLERNLVGTNSGNLVFLEAAYKLLATRDTEITTFGGRPDPSDAAWINERHDVYVIPLANAFRASFEPHLIAMTRLIERLRIPVVVLGVGAQSNLDYELDGMRPIERSVRAFVRAVLDKSPTIGVRGEFSQLYLHSLGFREVEVIGCPSMFMYGDRFEVADKQGPLASGAKVALSLSPDVAGMARIIDSHLARYPNLIYVAQDVDSLALMLWRQAPLGARGNDDFPLHLSHPLFRQNRARFFVDPWPWISYMRGFDFAFGTRIHGNIVALLAGTPAYVLAHDSRTLELARYFDMPYRRIDQLPADVDAAALYAEADYGPLLNGHAARFAAFAGFLQRHGLEHAYLEPEAVNEFEARIASTAYPPPVAVADSRPGLLAGTRRRLRYTGRRVARSDWARRLKATADRGSLS